MISVIPLGLILGWFAVLLEAQMSDSFSLYSGAVGIIVASLTIVSASFGIKWKTSARVAEKNTELIAEQKDIYREKAESLETDKVELLKLVGEQKEAISRLEALPNLTRVIELMEKTAQRQEAHANERLSKAMMDLERILEGHERRAEERHRELLEAAKQLLLRPSDAHH